MNKYALSVLMVGSSLAFAGGALAGSDCGGKAQQAAAHRFEKLDTNRDGKLNLAEFTSARETWLGAADTNQDGALTPAEIDASRAAQRAQRVQRMFERKDTNRDGKLTKEESRMPEVWFARVDANRDGMLTAEELSSGPKAEAGNKRGPARGKLQRLDENADGKVDRAELRNVAARQFTRLDRNSDGNVTAEEFGQRRGRGHGKHRQGGPEQKSEPKAVKPTAA